jgi:predicted TIM-barrel fold metal-dependent hydrolase
MLDTPAHRPGRLVDQWVDVHAHFYPPETDEVRRGRLDMMQEACWSMVELPGWSAEQTLAYMDRTGVQMQLLSNIPKNLEALRASNSFGASLVRAHPSRFGLLSALPTDDPDAALGEIARSDELEADGFAVTCRYNDVYLSDARLEPVWAELDRRQAVVFAHPDAYQPGSMGRPCAVVEVAFETARTFTDMLYSGLFRRYPSIRFIVAHCGGALPALSGRLQLLGLENWVPNPAMITPTEMRIHLRRLFLDTAATMPTALGAALEMTTPEHIVYGSDCGVPCSTDATMDANIEALVRFGGLASDQIQAIGRNALTLYPKAAARIPEDTAISR